jgi:hypothetical protein
MRQKRIRSLLDKKQLIPFCLIFIFILGRCPDILADTLYLLDGRELKGLVIEEYHDRILFKTHYFKDVHFYENHLIEEVFYDDPARNFLYLGRRSLEFGELAQAQRLFAKAQRIDSDLEEAGEALEGLRDAKLKKGFAAPPTDQTLLRTLGLRIERRHERFMIERVDSGGASFQAGIRERDALVKIFDIRCRFRNKRDVIEDLIGPPTSLVYVTIEREVVYRDNQLSFLERLFSQFPRELKLDMEYAGLTVTQVPEGGDFEEGDRIMAISGEVTRYMPLTRARERLLENPKVILTIQRSLKVKRR